MIRALTKAFRRQDCAVSPAVTGSAVKARIRAAGPVITLAEINIHSPLAEVVGEV